MKMLDLVLLGSFEEALMFSPQLGGMKMFPTNLNQFLSKTFGGKP